MLKPRKWKFLPFLIVSHLLISSCQPENQGANNLTPSTSPIPSSDYITDVYFDPESVISLAPGSDNWAITWASDGEQYTTWGDGGGFGGTNSKGRVSIGVGRIVGQHNDFLGINLWGGHNAKTPATFSGKSYGLIDIDNQLWMWKTGNKSGHSAFLEQTLYLSTDGGLTWQETEVSYTTESFGGKLGFYAPTFLQFGPGYSGAKDEYVYVYAPEALSDNWNVQIPGKISLFRAHKDKLGTASGYQFFAGLDKNHLPKWTADINQRQPVFQDQRGTMRTSASYNPGLKRYFLITQLISRFQDEGGMIGIFEAKEPWGPWKEVLAKNAWQLGLQNGKKTIFWNFSNKWTSPNGKEFTLVYTGPDSDSFGAIRGQFKLATDRKNNQH